MSELHEGLLHQQELWERRRQSGHGALDNERVRTDPLIVMLCGPIKHWWDENWMTPAHERYVAWRERVGEELVVAGHLVYRPHEAFKGAWTERAQPINDVIVAVADVIVVLTPPGVPSRGTDDETALAGKYGRRLYCLPPPGDPAQDEIEIGRLLGWLP